ncbi:MAG: hypothetical protein MJ016_02110 [Victivallaceae bacterium]|nr:hypothetical protein [Victivallaceae bacterium]
MIYPSLTDAQMKRSQRLFIGFNLLNGIGYICVGNMVMDLLAVHLHFSDVVFTTLGALFNIGCIWLPLGKIATEKWGAARTQSNFWLLRNFAAVVMGSCAIWGYFGHPYIACAFLLGGAFIFYGCRSAGSVMNTALVGNITHENERGKLLAFASMAHNIITAIVFIAMTFLLLQVEKLGAGQAIWALFGIILFGAFCGVLSAICLRNVDESDAIMKAAKKPLIVDAWGCLKDSAFRRMIVGEVCYSLGMALTIALNNLVLKRGLNVPDSWFLALSFLGSFFSVLVARPAAWLGDRIGPRKALIVGYCFSFVIVLFWQLIPETYTWHTIPESCTWYPAKILPTEFSPGIVAVALILFFLTSCNSLCCGICSGQYFLKCVPVEHQPSGLTLKMLFNGVLTGFIGMGLTAALWKICDAAGPDLVGMAHYRLFFLLGLPFLALFFIGVWMQKEV